MLSIGVDPGALGAAVAYDGSGYCAILKLKEGPHALNEFMQEHADAGFCSLERIVPVPGWRVQAICSLYGSYKTCEQAAALLSCPTEHVLPSKWQKHFGLYGMKPPKGLTESQRSSFKKNVHKERLVEVLDGRPFPKLTHVITDAALIAIWRLQVMGAWE